MIEPTDRKPAKSTTPKQRRAIEVLHNVLVDHGSRVTVTDVSVTGVPITISK